MKSYKQEIRDMKKFAKNISSSKKKAIKFLVGAGICTSTGKLTKFYKGGHMKVKAVKCRDCGSIVYSRARHDMRYCVCGKVSVDGGFSYNKVGFVDKKPESIEIDVNIKGAKLKNKVLDILYKDWASREDEYGLIPQTQYEYMNFPIISFSNGKYDVLIVCSDIGILEAIGVELDSFDEIRPHKIDSLIGLNFMLVDSCSTFKVAEKEADKLRKEWQLI